MAVFINRISVGSKTPIFVMVLTYVWLSQIWHKTASAVVRFTNARPTVDDTPRDSLTAQTISWDAILVAVVVGLTVREGAVLNLEVRGAKESVAPKDDFLDSESSMLKKSNY